MKKINLYLNKRICIYTYLFLLSIFIVFRSTGQTTTANLSHGMRNFVQVDLFDEYKLKAISDQVFVDSSTMVSTVTIEEGILIKLVLFVSTFNEKTGKYESKRLKTSHTTIHQNYGCAYIKIKGTIYRIRAKQGSKGEYEYFKDELVGDDFVESSEKILSGNLMQGYSYSMKIHKSLKYYYLTTFEGGDVSINVFDAKSFKLVSNKFFLRPKDCNVSFFDVKYTLEDNTFFLYYRYSEDKLSKLNIISTDGINFKQTTYKNKPNMYFKSYVVFKQNEDFKLYTFNSSFPKETEIKWNTTISNFDIENGTISEIDSKIITEDMIIKSYGQHKYKQYENGYDYSLCKVLKDDNSVYIINCANTYLNDYGLNGAGLVISKISDQELDWNQFVYRSARMNAFDKFVENCYALPSNFSLTEDNLIIQDGEYLNEDHKRKDPLTLIQILLDKETGKVSVKPL